MFRFLTGLSSERGNPLQTQKSASVWFRQLPAADPIGRQLEVIRALDEVTQATKRPDFACVAAIRYLDAELGADRSQLVTQYVESFGGRLAVADRIWKAAYDISQGFIGAYRKLLTEAIETSGEARWKREIAPLTARLIHHLGVDAKLRVLKSERWIPQKWVELNHLYRRAVDRRIERVAVDAGEATPPTTIEQEYIAVLITHLVNTGTLAPAQVDWVLSQTLARSHGLELSDAASATTAFIVDIDGKRGLVRRATPDPGHTLRYLDTGPLSAEIERAIAAMKASGDGERQSARCFEPARITMLEKLRAMISPDTVPNVSREPRADVSYEADVRVGLARICAHLANVQAPDAELGGERRKSPFGPANVGPVPAASRFPKTGGPPPEDAPRWIVQNRSNSGLRVSALGSARHGLTLGSLVAVRSRDGGDWALGVVRRMVRSTSEKIDVGVGVIALRFATIALHAKQHAREDMGFVVDGVDVSTMGPRFDGLYLPPPSRPSKPLSERSLVIPTTEHAAGRTIVAMAPRAIYTVVLRELLESHGEWSWTTVEIIDQTPRN